ncbi:MAG: hypothetical protein NVSMB9_24130 [Isosphaeraceae bacterium]
MGREISESQRNWLAGELDAWRDSGVLTQDHVKSVLGLYATAEEAGALRRSRGQVTLLALSALMVGMGVLLLIGYNWEAMPAWLKVVAIFSSVAGAHGAGFLVRYRLKLEAFSEAAFLLGCLLFGAGIWLIAQIFHINAGSGDGFWWWAIGVLPLAMVLETLVLHTLLVGLLALWVGFDMLGSGQLWVYLLGRASLPHLAYSLPVLAAPGFVWAYRRESARALALYVPLLVWWLVLLPFGWGIGDANPVLYIGAVGGLLLLAADLHREGSAMAIPYRFFGASLIAGALVPLSYYRFNTFNDRFNQFNRFNAWWFFWESLSIPVATLAVAVAAVFLVKLVQRRTRQDDLPGDPGKEQEIAAPEHGGIDWRIPRRQWFPCLVIGAMIALSFWVMMTHEALTPTLAANALMITLAFWLVQVGLREDRGRPFSAGVAYFLLWAVLRYIDLFGSFGGMLGAALVFFLCGLVLFGVVIYWRKRKEVVHV